MGLDSESPPSAPPSHNTSNSWFRFRSYCSRNGAVIGTGMGIVFLYLSFCIVIVGPWLWLTNTWGMCKFIFISTLSFMVVYNMLKTFITDPGSIPPGWTPSGAPTELEEARNRKELFRRDFRIKVRYCDDCQAFKPPRCHHCRICQRCVLKMDHHCPWVSACVGYQNQKYYVLFLLYAVTTGLILLATYTVWFFMAVYEKDEAEMEINGSLVFKVVLAGINIALLVISLALLFMLLSKQLKLIARNVTTIEVWEKIWAEQDCTERGQAYNHVYDLGTFKNLQQVFGPNILLWPFPSQPEGNGVQFPTNGRPEVCVVDIERMSLIQEAEGSEAESRSEFEPDNVMELEAV